MRIDPLQILNLDQHLVDYAASLWPADTGIEFEISAISLMNGIPRNMFFDQELPFLVAYSGIYSEVRFRIPKGIKGMITLHQLCGILTKYYKLNMDSGLHYHIQPKSYELVKIAVSEQRLDFMLKELESWKYSGHYNLKKISISGNPWIRYNTTYDTLECRIGEMTFDYALIHDRITHFQKLVRMANNVAINSPSLGSCI